jgi:FlaA1/EpsC-like NDP-sugar epimerase
MAVAQASSKVIGLGAGGHAKVLIEILQAVGMEITGLLDVDPRLWKSRQMGIIVLGSDELLPKLFEDGAMHTHRPKFRRGCRCCRRF